MYVFILLLILPALLVNLGLQPFIDDEGNRALVALEMLWRDNFVAPTLHGHYYYNKPPLWNWILALSFTLFGDANEWTARFPAVLSLLGFAGTIYYYYRRHFGHARAWLVALMFVTCGRMLFWESLLGLIDVAFSWAMFTLIMVVYHQGKARQWGAMFLLSYLLMVAGYMFKGLPAIVFQGLTLLAFLIAEREWKRLFSWAHIGSGLLALALLAGYYLVYNQYNGLGNVFTALFVESGKRTAVAYSLWDTVRHVVSLPFELSYHFLPWTLLLLLLPVRDYRRAAWSQPIVRYSILMLIVNISIYWLSPNFYPRYILMLVPLGFAALAALVPDTATTRWARWLEVAMGVFIGLLWVATLVTAFIPDTQFIGGLYAKVAAVALVLAALGWQYKRLPASRYFLLVAALLVFRIGFNWVALPPRSEDSSAQRFRDSNIAFAQRWAAQDIKIFYDTHVEPAGSFYMERTAGRIIPRQMSNFDRQTHYLYSPQQYDPCLFAPPVDSVSVRHAKVTKYYYLARLQITDSLTIEELTVGENPGF